MRMCRQALLAMYATEEVQRDLEAVLKVGRHTRATAFWETIVCSENTPPLDESLQATALEPVDSFLLDPVAPNTRPSTSAPSTSFCVAPVGTSTPCRLTPAKRKRPDSSILLMVENLLDSDAEL
ncbi:hypothetical protein PFLUV_G00067250 [Perca fluviatilis]|uniref:Uncharacterized protein n=1 Tax=Perca fluviatilis TaxID=8168 RepID=A0A6A5FG18_PERFL|nr:hypothetical protein PFLUV_G00067250 [Perca fluviatilis]